MDSSSFRSVTLYTLRKNLVVIHIISQPGQQRFRFCTDSQLSIRCYFDLLSTIYSKILKVDTIDIKACPHSFLKCPFSQEHIFKIRAKPKKCCTCQHRKDLAEKKILDKHQEAETKVLSGLNNLITTRDRKTLRNPKKQSFETCPHCVPKTAV